MVTIGYDSIRAMIEMGIVYELILPDRKKEYTVLIPYGGQATSNAAESRLNARVIPRHQLSHREQPLGYIQMASGSSRHQ